MSTRRWVPPLSRASWFTPTLSVCTSAGEYDAMSPQMKESVNQETERDGPWTVSRSSIPLSSGNPSGTRVTGPAAGVGDGPCDAGGTSRVLLGDRSATVSAPRATTATAAAPPSTWTAVRRRRCWSPRRRTSVAGRDEAGSRVMSRSGSKRSDMAAPSRGQGVVEQGVERGAAPREPRLDGADGGAQLDRDLGDREVAEVVQHERAALVGGQAVEGGHEGHARL